MSATFTDRLRVLAARVDAALERSLPPANVGPVGIHEAMRYSVFAGGKRVRPALCLLVARAEALSRGEDADAAERSALDPACALEMVHTYSLIHDDLPCMDDDDMRRGKPTCHKAFGEAMAVLAGDALNTLAFATAANAGGSTAGALVRLLALCSGTEGMVGGQVDDLEAMASEGSAELLESIHERKTAMLFVASAGMGAISAGADDRRQAQWEELGRRVGLAFQIVDDILDVTASAGAMGKRTGKDAEAGKLTYPGHFGLEESIVRADAALDAAAGQLTALGDPEGDLGTFVQFLRERTH